MNQTTANAAALALVGALALQLAACGTAQQSAPGQASTQPEPVTLTMSWWGDDARTETYQQAIQAFEAKLQYITVETIYGTTADEDQTADVMQVDWTWPGQNADQFVDLNEYSDVIDLEQFSQSALDACTVDGALLAVPMSVTGRIFYWNTCTFEQAGIDAPKTYEELLTAGNTFREVLGEEYYPLAMDAAARMNLMFPDAEKKCVVESFRKQETQKNHNHYFSEWLEGSDPDYHTAQDLYYKLAKRDGYMRSI